MSDRFLQNHQPLTDTLSDLIQFSGTIVAASIHPTTKELVFLLNSPEKKHFELVLPDLDGNKITLETLCYLNHSFFHSGDADSQPTITGLTCHDRLVVIFTPTLTYYFDSTTGVALAPPQRIADPVPWNTASVVGATHGAVSRTDHSLWQLSLPPIFQQAAN